MSYPIEYSDADMKKAARAGIEALMLYTKGCGIDDMLRGSLHNKKVPQDEHNYLIYEAHLRFVKIVSNPEKTIVDSRKNICVITKYVFLEWYRKWGVNINRHTTDIDDMISPPAEDTLNDEHDREAERNEVRRKVEIYNEHLEELAKTNPLTVEIVRLRHKGVSYKRIIILLWGLIKVALEKSAVKKARKEAGYTTGSSPLSQDPITETWRKDWKGTHNEAWRDENTAGPVSLCTMRYRRWLTETWPLHLENINFQPNDNE